MRVVDPGQPTAARPLPTAGMTRLLPNAPKLIDAGFVLLLTMVALFGFRTTFDSAYFLVVSAIAATLGVLVAHLVQAVRWHWTLALVGAVAVYFLLGGPLAVRRDLIAGVVPSGATFAALSSLALDGWKQLLTSLPPLDGSGSLLALPWLLGVVGGAAGYSLARATRLAPVPLIPLVALFGLVIALGTDAPVALMPQSMVWAAAAAVWVAYRATRQNRLATTSTPRTDWGRLSGGAALLLVAGLVAALVGPYLPGLGQTRVILRDKVQAPIDLNQYPSPLPSFRKYSSAALRDSYFHDSALLTVSGASPGALIRFAVLDSYDGLVWGAGGGGFRKVGSRIPTVVDGRAVPGDPVSLTITINDVYATQAPLNIWVPSLGYATAVGFTGATAPDHRDALAYDLGKGQGLVLDQPKSGDVITVESIPLPVASGQPLTAAGASLVPSSRTAFFGDDLAKMTGGNVAPWDRLANLADAFRKGGWSDGTTGADFAQYTPGSGEDRLKAFLATIPSYVGSDEQYAAMFALVANRVGFPARVVFGAVMPGDSEVVMGRDVTVWVELRTTEGWVAVPPDFFIPPRDQLPQPPPPDQTTPPQDIPDIAAANPKLPPDKLSNMDTQAQVTPPPPPEPPRALPWWGWAGVYAGSSVLGLVVLAALLVGIKAVRTWWRHRRGTPVTQIAGGWYDTIDHLRDLGVKIPRRMTRQEQVAALVGVGTTGVCTGTGVVPVAGAVSEVGAESAVVIPVAGAVSEVGAVPVPIGSVPSARDEGSRDQGDGSTQADSADQPGSGQPDSDQWSSANWKTSDHWSVDDGTPAQPRRAVGRPRLKRRTRICPPPMAAEAQLPVGKGAGISPSLQLPAEDAPKLAVGGTGLAPGQGPSLAGERTAKLATAGSPRLARKSPLTPESLAALAALATSTDRAMFSATPPGTSTVDAYWSEVVTVKTTLLSNRQGLRRLWTRLTPRSLPPIRRPRVTG